jgi:phenolic acid decarboxylase
MAWITVGELAKTVSLSKPEANILPPTADLVGTELNLHFENGWIIKYKFETTSKLHWSKASAAKRSRWIEEIYLAIKVREGIYLLDYLKHLERATSVSLVLDLDAGIFTAVIGQLPTRLEAKQAILDRALADRELTSVKATFLSGSINKSFSKNTPRHTTTEELVGKRLEYTYSPTERYEHVYLNENFYTWHCLAGAEKKGKIGLADTDRCHYYKLRDNLYLFVWREKIIPTLGLNIIDLDGMRACGKLFGYQSNDFGNLTNFHDSGRSIVIIRP